MKSTWIFRRRLPRLKLLLYLFAVFGFAILYNNYSEGKLFQGKIKPMKFQEKSFDLHDKFKFAEKKMTSLDNGRNEAAADAQTIRPSGGKLIRSQSLKKKAHEYKEKEKGRTIEEIKARNPRFVRNTEMTNGQMAQKRCKEKGILKKYSDEVMPSIEIACKPHMMSEEACKFTKDIYSIDNRLKTCEDNNTEIYCYLKQQYSLDFDCRNIEKYRYCQISGLDMKNGDVEVQKIVTDLSELKTHLKFLASVAIAYKSNFLFLQCFRKIKSKVSKTQIILLPFKIGDTQIYRNQEKVNVNIVLLDSISRAHFYRSLPVVLKTFNDINSDVNSKAEVLDFELFQSVHGHSAENFHTFFTGKLLPKNMTTKEKEQANVGVENLYGFLKNLGYETMYQDDLCWKYWWGIRMELGMAANWRMLQQSITSSKIDYTGLTFASCKILGLNNLQTPFSGPENSQICLNGRFQHSYIFEHLLQYFNRSGRRKPRVSFTTINTGHDYKGTRVQTLNNDLSTFVRKISTLENTLTILMADHGNTYTSYTSTMLEGRFEMYHPSFFMILPESVKRWLGKSALGNLRQNTKRLFTMADVHNTILEVARRDHSNARREGNEKGLLRLIPAARQCNDLELALPNLCVCEGWDTPAKNDTVQVGALEYAVGMLNNLIDSQWKEGKKKELKVQRNCHRLFAKSFRNVRERSEKGDLITTMDFTVDSGRGSGQTEDVFHVEIKSVITRGSTSRNMTLLSYDRLSQYGIYRKCKDPGVNVKLCVCSLKGFDKHDSHNLLLDDGSISISALIRNQPQWHNIPSVYKLEESSSSECIYISTKEYRDRTEEIDSSFITVIEIINICSKGNIHVLLSIETINCETSHNFPMTVKAESQSINFVSVVIRTVWYWSSSYQILTLTVPEQDLHPSGGPYLPPLNP